MDHIMHVDMYVRCTHRTEKGHVSIMYATIMCMYGRTDGWMDGCACGRFVSWSCRTSAGAATGRPAATLDRVAIHLHTIRRAELHAACL